MSPRSAKVTVTIGKKVYILDGQEGVVRHVRTSLSPLSSMPGGQAEKRTSAKNNGFCPIPSDIFTSICMDFVDLDACTDSEGRVWNCCLVVVCRLSGYEFLILSSLVRNNV